MLGGLCAALLFLAGLPQIGHTAEPVPLKTAWLGEHEAFAAWYAKQKGWDLEEGFRLKMLSYDSGKQLMAGMNTAHWEIAACGAIPALTASLDNQAEIIAIGNDESLATGIYARKDSPILGHTGYNALYPEMAGTGGTVRSLILHDYGHFAVLTIDKFFQRIIRSFIRELGIDLNFNLELPVETLLGSAADRMIEEITSDDTLREWITAFVNDRIEDGRKWDIRGELLNLGGELFKEEYKRGRNGWDKGKEHSAKSSPKRRHRPHGQNMPSWPLPAGYSTWQPKTAST